MRSEPSSPPSQVGCSGKEKNLLYLHTTIVLLTPSLNRLAPVWQVFSAAEGGLGLDGSRTVLKLLEA